MYMYIYKSHICNLERFFSSFHFILTDRHTGVDDIARSGGLVSNKMNENNLLLCDVHDGAHSDLRVLIGH
jgi:hypothetical protein